MRRYKTKPLSQGFLSTADDGTRTRDLLTTNEVRYHLCHISVSKAQLYV